MESPLKPQASVEFDLSVKLYNALEKLRTVLIKEAGEGVMPYHIFVNTTMKQMSERIPRTLEELRDIYGIGDVKVIKRVLETIEATIKENTKTDKNNKSNGDSDLLRRKGELIEGDEASVEKDTLSKPKEDVESDFSVKLYNALKRLRTVLVKEAGEGVVAYQIFQNATMEQMCERIPRTLEELRDIHGIGKVKLDKYGARVLETIESTIKENADAYEKNTKCNGRSDSVKRKRRDRAKTETPPTPQNGVESEFSTKLYNALKKLRTALVEEAGEGVFAYHIFLNATMKQMCERVPRTMEELRGIHGIGNVKANKYGTRVLETIEATIKENAEAYKNNTCSNIEIPSKSQDVESDFSSKLYNALRKLRTVLVKEAGEGVLPFHIFTNATLNQICEKLPRTLKGLLDIHGIRNVKVNKYGARVLETIEATIKESNKTNKNSSISNSLKRERDQVEFDDDRVKITGRSKIRVSREQFPGAEVVDYDEPIDNHDMSLNSNMNTIN